MVPIISIHYFIITGVTFRCVFSASESNYSFPTSILLNNSDHELLLPDISGSGWENVFLPQKINKQGGCNKNVCIFDKLNSQGGIYFGQDSNQLGIHTNVLRVKRSKY